MIPRVVRPRHGGRALQGHSRQDEILRGIEVGYGLIEGEGTFHGLAEGGALEVEPGLWPQISHPVTPEPGDLTDGKGAPPDADVVDSAIEGASPVSLGYPDQLRAGIQSERVEGGGFPVEVEGRTGLHRIEDGHHVIPVVRENLEKRINLVVPFPSRERTETEFHGPVPTSVVGRENGLVVDLVRIDPGRERHPVPATALVHAEGKLDIVSVKVDRSAEFSSGDGITGV